MTIKIRTFEVPVVLVAALVSIAWLAVWFLFSMNLTKPCDTSTSDTLASHLYCLSASDAGDWLAGALSPLAIGWLIVAVILQGRELRAQREELALTRDEMKESREVLAAQKSAMDEQVVEARKNVELIERQIKSQSDSLDIQNRISVSKTIDELINTAKDVSSIGNSFYIFQYRQGENIVFHAQMETNSTLSPFQYIKTLNGNLLAESSLIDKIQRNFPNFRRGEENLIDLLRIYLKINDLADSATEVKRMELGILQIPAAAEFLTNLLRTLGRDVLNLR